MGFSYPSHWIWLSQENRKTLPHYERALKWKKDYGVGSRYIPPFLFFFGSATRPLGFWALSSYRGAQDNTVPACTFQLKQDPIIRRHAGGYEGQIISPRVGIQWRADDLLFDFETCPNYQKLP